MKDHPRQYITKQHAMIVTHTSNLRLILAFVCLAYILYVIVPFIIYLDGDSQFRMVNLLIYNYEIRWILYSVASVPLVLALLGALNACFLNIRLWDLFSLLTLLTLVVSIGLLVYIGQYEPSILLNMDIYRMRNFTNNYDWKGTATSDKDILFGNVVQYYGDCCGLYSYTDWDSMRPKYIQEDMYPGSCCKLQDGQLCSRNVVVAKPSCYYRAREFSRDMQQFALAHLAFLLLMSLVSLFTYELSYRLCKRLMRHSSQPTERVTSEEDIFNTHQRN